MPAGIPVGKPVGKPAQRCMLAGGSALGADAGCGYFVQVALAGKVAVPGAYGRTLRNRPLLRGLPARTYNAPYFLHAARGKHGLQMNIGSTASKAGADGMWIKFFHAASIAALPWHHKDCYQAE